jgi:DNA-directed RNA polymerase specialized sigma24 family protein
MYDEGYSGKEIGKFFGIPAQTVYSRIDANRGRGPNLKSA